MYSATSILGVVALIFYTFPLLGIIFLPLATLYYVLSIFYRRTSVETKRLDSLLRSILFSSFSGECLCLNHDLAFLTGHNNQKL
jgi:ATP-binding cassette, subfamily C (CFTR/MRP), member 1